MEDLLRLKCQVEDKVSHLEMEKSRLSVKVKMAEGGVATEIPDIAG